MKNIVFLVVATIPFDVSAHVKWFSDFNFQEPPKDIANVLTNAHFLTIFMATALIIFLVSYIDRGIVGSNQAWRYLGRVRAGLSSYAPIILRVGIGCYLVSLALLDNTILTPEITKSDPWLSTLQLCFAFSLVFRRTCMVAGLGILYLCGYAVSEYGVFHVLDYPFFIGIAIYLMHNSLFGDKQLNIATQILRVTTASTLLWAAIEKWAFPEWSFSILNAKPELAFGISWNLYIMLAGFVEFCAAFLIVTGKTSARLALVLLLAICISAIPVFGKIDAIGHTSLITVLIVLLLSENSVAENLEFANDNKKTAELITCWYVVAIFGYMFTYYSGYHIEYSPAQVVSNVS